MKKLSLALFAFALLVLPVATVRAQVAQPGSTTVTQKITSNAVTAGSSQTATISGVSGQFSCMQAMTVTLDVPTSGTVAVSGNVTISDGTWTVNMLCDDTVSAGAWCEYHGPVLQSSAVNTTITATVPAISNGGAGKITIIGYVNPGQC